MEQELNKCLDVEAVRDKLQFRDLNPAKFEFNAQLQQP